MQHKRPITLCGEMASNPAAFTLLLGMGLRKFSMSPAYIPSIKELASNLHIEQAQTLLKKALKERQSKKIRKMMSEQLMTIAPKLAPILTRDS